MSERRWKLLLTGDASGIVLPLDYDDSRHPQHYERVVVVKEELEEENARLRRALQDIAQPYSCGCTPICRCFSDSESARAIVDGIQDIARQALETKR